MAATFTPEMPLVTAQWLKSHIGAPDVRVLDATYASTFKPGVAQTGRLAYDAHHIPGARFFDIDLIADLGSPYPHMMPPPEQFASRVRRLGLGDGHRIVCYDQNAYLASARAWWMFRAMGHGDVAVLDGGFAAWKAAGGPVEDLPPTASADRHFTARFRGGLVRNLDQMKQAQSTGALQIVDARAAARFRGEVDEPRAGLARGHIPGALNVPYTTLLQEDGRFKSPEAIAAIFGNAGVNLAKPIVNTCGSGVTAAILALAEAIAGNEMAAVYDASWCEWGAPDTGAPIATA
ncbi:MAG: 3-mercaptopyruvate sulfurtransferase [Alphaproteobacteria bacterium]|nr:3-mercaptopyruvate sulfurtransferase [Alphaproteobacteria bacterium]